MTVNNHHDSGCSHVYCLLGSQAKIDMLDGNDVAILLHACQNKNNKIVKTLLKWGADVNFSGEETLLTMACKGGSTEVKLVNRLLSNKLNPDLNKPIRA